MGLVVGGCRRNSKDITRNPTRKKGEEMHIVVFPWLATGHLIPFLKLSKLLVLHGHTVWFISTPENLRRLSPFLGVRHEDLRLVPVTVPSVTGLPRHVESSMDIPPSLSQLLKIGFDNLLPSVSSFLVSASPRPDWIVHDYASYWIPPLGIPSVFFSLFTAVSTVFSTPPPGFTDTRTTPYHFTTLPEWVPFASGLRLRLHEALRIVNGAGDLESGISDTLRFSKTMAGSDVVLIRTCPRLEPEWLNLMGRLYNKHVIPLGLLPPPPEDGLDRDGDDGWVAVKSFLDTYDSGKVVYVALGSEVRLEEEEAEELKLGLELSGVGFLLVLRGACDNHVETATVGGARGLVYKGWAPQTRILRHRAIGGFLTHCGWNSIVEGLCEGRVLILLPMINEQGLNCRLMVEKGVGVEVFRDGNEGVFTRQGVAEAVQAAMVDENGENLRSCAKEMKAMFCDNDGLEEFIKYLDENKSKSKYVASTS